MSNPLSVVIITKNEEKFIKDAILSAKFADEVLVLDSGSIDKTCYIAKELSLSINQRKSVQEIPVLWNPRSRRSSSML